MGVNYGKDVLYSLSGLSRKDIALMCRRLAIEHDMTDPSIDVDCSYVGFKVGKHAQKVANFLVKWSMHGLQMNPICDGKRPISKQATNKRKAEREKNRINAHLLRLEILSLNRKLSCDELSDSQRNDIREEIATKQRTMKSKETQARNVMQPNFEEKLIEELDSTGAHVRNDANGWVTPVRTAEFQADAVIMGRVAAGKTLMAISGDADLPLIEGDDFVEIKEFMKDGSMEIVSTSRKTVEKLQKHLTDAQKNMSDDEKSQPIFKAAAYPILEGVEDRKLRALMALFLGCDVYVKGMTGVGAKTLSDIINVEYPKFKQKHNSSITLRAYLKKYMRHYTDGFDKDVIHTYIRALIYEPTNVKEIDGAVERTYLGGAPPTTLPADYLEEFACGDNTEIHHRVKVEECKGVGGCSHKFLSADGFDTCNICDEIVCIHCRDTIDGKTHCLPCFAAESLVPESDVAEGGTPISVMRDELHRKHGVEKVNELTVEEVEEMYAIKEIATLRIKDQLGNVPFPLHPTCEMTSDETEHWTTVVDDVNFGEGGAFLSDPDFDPQYLPGTLNLFASLVTFESAKRTDWVHDPAIFNALPSTLIDMAKNCRLDDGYRLLKRCVRHAFDSRCKSIDGVIASLVVDKDDNIGIRIGTDIPASMRKDIYQTEIVATATAILCCMCSCKCGSQGLEQIVCVHTMVVLLLLTVLLVEDLAESMLIALASRISGSIDSTQSSSDSEDLWMWNMNIWTDDEIDSMKHSIITLMGAAGETVPDADSKTIPELLQAFIVGTEGRKKWKEKSKIPPKPCELGPISGKHFMSHAKRAQLTMHPKGCTTAATPPANDIELSLHKCSLPDCPMNEDCHHQDKLECSGPSCHQSAHRLCQQRFEAVNRYVEETTVLCKECHPKSPLPPDYLQIVSLMKVADCDMDDSNIVGHRLLELRGVKKLGRDFSKQKVAEKKANEDWKELQKLTHHRSRNMATSQTANLSKNHTEKTTSSGVATSKTPTASKRRRGVVTPSPPQPPKRSRLRRKDQLLPMRRPKDKKKRVYKARPGRNKHYKCHMWGGRCKVNSTSHPNMKWNNLPTYPKELKPSAPRHKVINRYGTILLREESLRRMGYNANDRGCYRVCSLHGFEHVTKDKQVRYKHGKNKEKEETFSSRFQLTVPLSAGPGSNALKSTTSKGTGTDRQTTRILTDMIDTVKEGELPPGFSMEAISEELASTKPETPREKQHHAEEQLLLTEVERDQMRSDLVRANLTLTQVSDLNSDEKHIPINPIVKRTIGLDVHDDVNDCKVFTKHHLPPKDEKKRQDHSKTTPMITLDMPDNEVKRRTGFPTMQHLLSYIFIVCDGDFNVITRKQTVLTWLEAWFMHFEFKWGRTLPRVKDIAAAYGPDHKHISKEIHLKYSIERSARDRWPTYVSYEEDISLRNSEKWDAKYSGMRVVFWDMTNIPAYGFSDSDFNRITYSKYYGMNCFKGGVFNQLCGWIGTADLWPGATSDTVYNKEARYLQEQEQYQNNDLVNDKVLPWTNVYDKGYRAKLVAHRAGKQRVLQPVWAESDRRFGRDETLLTAAVAHDRGSNERAVNVCKRSWFVSKGFQPNASAKQLNDAWMTWSFQANFMFNPVL